MKALILHGVGGFAGKHWMQWLHDKLINLNIEVTMPTLPNSENPSYVDWILPIKKIFDEYSVSDLNELIVIGHSMGVPASLEVIQDLPTTIKGLFSASGFYKDYGSEINTKFMNKCSIDIEKARKNIQNPFVFYADNDPYVPQEILNELAIGLRVEPIIIKNGGHLNTDAGFTKFDLLLEKINTIL